MESSGKNYTILGLMSGTSMDGLDCGLFSMSLNNQYEFNWHLIDFKTFPYSNHLREEIRTSLLGDEKQIQKTHSLLGKEFAAITTNFLQCRPVDIIASHGQTVAHIDRKSSLQIGDAKFLREAHNCPVVYNFRQADIDAGGNGAPLTPFLDYLVFKNTNRATITLNLGGIANISYIPENGKIHEVMGFDTGPAMSLIDELCQMVWGEKLDYNGNHSLQGEENAEILSHLMQHPYLAKSPPKSTGRHSFGKNLVKQLFQKYPQVKPEDFAASFCVFTAKSIAENLEKHLNFTPSRTDLIVSGGGVHHPVIMQTIEKYISARQILTSEKVGINPDLKESLLMAVLGLCKVLDIPSNIKSVTGAKQSIVLGHFV
jgi:anhydro-N-acetylmuramic acid kinase